MHPSSSCCLCGFFNPLRFDLLFAYVELPGTAKWLALSTETRTDTSKALGDGANKISDLPQQREESFVVDKVILIYGSATYGKFIVITIIVCAI